MTWSLASGLDGKAVLVIGATGGIGSAVTRAFASAGARLLATDIDQTTLDGLLETLDGEGHIAMAADLRDLSSQDALVDRAVGAFGRLDVLANLAGVVRRRYALADVTEDDWDLQLDVNLKAAFFLCRRAASAMIKNGGGRIVTFSSQAWWTGGFAGYGRHGITVNAVSPGLVDTPMITTNMNADAFEGMAHDIPLGYVAAPDDVAGVVLFLASDHARYVTGATINVSGGMSMY